ncbi:MAG: SDR family NAD(P)-dependent oxidoreductase [bacterium]|nr:SDR family NAD(P)-dependent oxidoreductase [bacterium]
MSKRVLITGGAGFIGSHLADSLLANGYHVRVIDNLAPQVHGERAERPAYLSRDVEFILGDVRNPAAVRRALHGVDVVYHLAAIVGVGQSMYEIRRYTDTNNIGTAVLLEALIERPVERLIVASSMSIYGEGLYRSADGRVQPGHDRSVAQLQAGDWELYDESGAVLTPVPTPESKTPSLASLYALNKYDQEQMCLIIGAAYRIPTVALRFFNAYGTRQALSNPYTGVLAIFASRILNGAPPLIYEDGAQMRDFVSVNDVAQACVLALDSAGAPGHAFNVGSGQAFTVRQTAELACTALGRPSLEPHITGKYRMGDIRHCFPDISRARDILGYRPRVRLEDGLQDLAGWLEGQVAVDRVTQAIGELAARGLTI